MVCTYCRSLRCCRFFLNALFTRNIRNAARSMDSDGEPLSPLSDLSPLSPFFEPSLIVSPPVVSGGLLTHAPSEFTLTVSGTFDGQVTPTNNQCL